MKNKLSQIRESSERESLHEALIKDLNKTRKNESNGITSYLLLLALSIHACFEGMAIGLQDNASKIIYMFIAISFHKWVEALSIGINLNKSNIERSYFFKFIILFSSMTPIGILIGIIFSGFSDVVEAIFLSISAGKNIFTKVLSSTSELLK